MKKIILSLLILNISLMANSFARKPAVEDFVGVESQDYKETPKGTEVIFNFGQHIQKFKNEVPTVSPSGSSDLSGGFGLLAIFSFIALPFLMWFGIAIKTKHVTKSKSFKSGVESSENIANLSDYRSDEQSSDEKKAS
jgi:hypothetical protein